MVDCPTAQQGAPPGYLGGALRLLRSHPAVVSAVARPQDGTDVYVPVDIELRIEMYQSWMAVGHSPNGVRKTEPITLVFFSDYPFSAPIPLLRADFDCSVAHVNPGRLWKRPIPCIYEGNNGELLLQRGLGGIIDQLVTWLTNAALGTLIDPKQGWEPVRRDSLDDFVIADSDALRSHQTDKGGHAVYRFDYFRSKSSGKFIHYGQLGSAPVPINPKNIGDYFKDRPVGDAEQSSFSKGLGLVVWPGRDSAGKPIVADKYLPETVSTLQDLYDRADLYGCKPGLRDAIAWLGQCLTERETSEPIPLVVILTARRPFHLINSASDLELNPYLLEFFAPNMFPGGTVTPVRPAGYRDAVAPALLRTLSGSPHDAEVPPYVMVGAGSLGSKLLLHATRAGMAPSHVIDRSYLSPHNAARHALLPSKGPVGLQFIGNKAEEAVKIIANFGQQATAHDGNVVDVLRDQELARKHLHKKNWAVINSTASLVVREAFASTPPEVEIPRVIETALFGEANFGLVTVEGPKRNPNSGELITEAYEIFRVDKDTRKGIFEAQSNLKRVVIGDGCGSLTMTASDARISLLAAPMAEMIQDLRQDGLPETGRIALAKVVAQGRGLQWHDFNVPRYERIITEDGSDWHVSVSPRARDKIAADVRRWRNVETGGVLLGRVSEAAHTFYIVDVLPAPPDSRRSRSEFVLGVKGLRRALADYVRSTTGCLYCLGTWHSHLADCGPSSVDHSTARVLALARAFPSVMLIHTPAGFRAIAADISTEVNDNSAQHSNLLEPA